VRWDWEGEAAERVYSNFPIITPFIWYRRISSILAEESQGDGVGNDQSDDRNASIYYSTNSTSLKNPGGKGNT
jgi:hypothetical protein